MMLYHRRCMFYACNGGRRGVVDDFKKLLRCGATRYLSILLSDRPDLISRGNKFGSQCVVLAIDARLNDKGFEVFEAAVSQQALMR